jgi:hypothetical protein
MHKFLRNIEPSKEFIVVDGAHLRNLDELALLLDAIDDLEFNHHVSPHHNDFAAWVRDVIGDAELADELLRRNHPHSMAKATKHRIRELRIERREELRPGFFSRIAEFILGLVIGYLVGMFVARMMYSP